MVRDEIDFDLSPKDEDPFDEGDGERKQEAADDDDHEEDYGGAETEGRFSSLGEKVKLVIFCVLGCLLIIGIVWGSWYFVKKSKQAPPLVADMQTQEQEQEQEETPPVGEALLTRHITFQDFMIPLSDGAGYRILKIDFTVEIVAGINEAHKSDMGYDPGVRRQIVNAIQMHGRDLLTAKNSRELVKNDLLSLMMQILGENVVKNVYITSFTFI